MKHISNVSVQKAQIPSLPEECTDVSSLDGLMDCVKAILEKGDSE